MTGNSRPEPGPTRYCGAKTRAATPCKRKDLYASGRCALHGGLSTGPTTPEGRVRALANLALRWRPRLGGLQDTATPILISGIP